MSRTYRKHKHKSIFPTHDRGASVIDYLHCGVAKGWDDGGGMLLTRARRRVWKFAARMELIEYRALV